MTVPVLVRLLDPAARLPAYAYPGDAGADLICTVEIALEPGGRASVPTGVALALPPGYAGFVHPRSGLAQRHGIGIVNAPGTVDCGYRGEIFVELVNHGRAPVTLPPGERIAQLVVQRVEQCVFTAAAALPDSVRGARGHGSSGR